MDKNQSSTRNVSALVTAYITKNASVFSPIPNLSAANSQLLNNYNLTNTLSEQQEANRTGHTDNKRILRDDLIKKAYEICEKCFVYATQANNLVLAKEMSYSISSFKRSKISNLRDKAILIYDRATANISNLATYNVTATMLTALKTVIDSYTLAISNKRASIVEGKQIGEQIQAVTVSSNALI